MADCARIKAKTFLNKYGIQKLNIKELIRIIESQGFTIIEYNNIDNNEDVQNIIDVLRVKPYTQLSRAFTYVDNNNRLVFVNEDLSEEEKLIVLAHEEGHIFCEHFGKMNVIGYDVTMEHEANEFAHYILKDSISRKINSILHRHIKLVIVLICLILITMMVTGIGLYIHKQNSYFGEFYVTATGTKYHREDCIYVKNKTNIRRLTLEEYESGKYKPCKVCLPDE